MNKPDFGFAIHHIRILFGPLFGTDLMLPDEETFFYVGNSMSEQTDGSEPAEHSLNYSVNTLYIPYQAEQPNFRVKIEATPHTPDDKQKDTTTPADFTAEFFHPEEVEIQPAKFNTICRFGDIVFSVKRAQDEWCDEVRQYVNRPGEQNGGAAPNLEHGAEPDAREGKLRFAAKIAAIVIAGAAVTGLAYWQMQQYVHDQKIASVSSLFTGAPAHNDVLAGSDGKIYVVSASQDGAEWARQVVMKAAPAENVQVVSAVSERRRIEQWLDRQGVDFVTVRLDRPAQPCLFVTHGVYASRDARNEAVFALQQAAPYASDVQIKEAGVAAIEREARAALDKAGVRYKRLSRPTGATFEVAGALNDGELAALQDLVLSFDRKWGTHRVDFKIAMRTDWLKGKSYREGGEGYVLLDRASWYFPQPLKGVSAR